MKNKSPGIYQGVSNVLQDNCSFPPPPSPHSHLMLIEVAWSLTIYIFFFKKKLFYLVIKEFGLNYKDEK